MTALLWLAAQAVTATLPPAYLGAWASVPALCGQEDTGGVVIQPAAMTFYEARGTVRTVAVDDAHRVTVTLDYEGEGRRWSETDTLRLDGGKLVVTAMGQTTTLHRCPPTNGN